MRRTCVLAGEQQQALESGPARLGLDARGVGSTAVVVPLQQLHRLHLERIAACKPTAAERLDRPFFACRGASDRNEVKKPEYLHRYLP